MTLFFSDQSLKLQILARKKAFEFFLYLLWNLINVVRLLISKYLKRKIKSLLKHMHPLVHSIRKVKVFHLFHPIKTVNNYSFGIKAKVTIILLIKFDLLVLTVSLLSFWIGCFWPLVHYGWSRKSLTSCNRYHHWVNKT